MENGWTLQPVWTICRSESSLPLRDSNCEHSVLHPVATHHPSALLPESGSWLLEASGESCRAVAGSSPPDTSPCQATQLGVCMTGGAGITAAVYASRVRRGSATLAAGTAEHQQIT
jgi:hypothetical protein